MASSRVRTQRLEAMFVQEALVKKVLVEGSEALTD